MVLIYHAWAQSYYLLLILCSQSSHSLAMSIKATSWAHSSSSCILLLNHLMESLDHQIHPDDTQHIPSQAHVCFHCTVAQYGYWLTYCLIACLPVSSVSTFTKHYLSSQAFLTKSRISPTWIFWAYFNKCIYLRTTNLKLCPPKHLSSP